MQHRFSLKSDFKIDREHPPHRRMANLTEAGLTAFTGKLSGLSQNAVFGFRKLLNMQVEAEDVNKSTKELLQATVPHFYQTLRAAWVGTPEAVAAMKAFAEGSLTFSDRGFGLETNNPLGLAAVLCYSDYTKGRLGICSNPDCASRYFVRGRRNQKFCTAPLCFLYMQRANARNYWRKKHWK